MILIKVARMELWPGAWTVLLLLFLLLLFLLPALWFCSPSAKYFFKMAFYNGWILFLAVLAIPVCAVRGRNVENMKILRLMLLHIKYLYGIRVEVRGAHHFPPSQPYVVVSNHQSSLDLLGMMEVLPSRCVPIAKRELLWAGSAGLACWLAGVIFIDRKRTGDAINVMSEVAQTLLTQDVRVWVFPEGTRNHNGSMLPFKRGAFHLAVQAQVPIVPIVMSSYQDFYCKKERRFTSVASGLIHSMEQFPTPDSKSMDSVDSSVSEEDSSPCSWKLMPGTVLPGTLHSTFTSLLWSLLSVEAGLFSLRGLIHSCAQS
ncbi:1-acyl-sn-glycerol-3-phosphate acyltransferase alpha isoform X3 [Erinaceus europaeus]|uniref:1-acyl-sn-glycerol-3-phosphate acyltransferase n=1 Tax=Erinaceus europaeus TaxID=9365 RepID=A0ABM3X9N0_ERIEU|nr:1-acyl-sn-glycerol-3-phosphate acyltransferase alpha isoform X3 [Erinaceus europaeus]